MPHTSLVEVRFGDVDGARIVYYPRLFHLLHIAFEDFFRDHVGIPYDRLISERNRGFPTVSLRSEFVRPIRYGETLRVETTVPEIGRTSALFRHVVTVGDDDDRRAVVTIRRVSVDMETLRPEPIDDELRARFEQA